MATQRRPVFDVLEDRRVNCLSVMTTMSTREYLQKVKSAYENRGGIAGQREKLQTTSAIRIRKRMVDDIRGGAVLPPVVIGLVLTKQIFSSVRIGVQSKIRH